MKFAFVGTVCALFATLTSASKGPSPAFLAQVAKNEYNRGFQAALNQTQKAAPVIHAQQEDSSVEDLSYTREDGTFVAYDDASWNYEEYVGTIYSDYHYIDSNGRKITFGNPAFNWDEYYAWYYAQTFFYTTRDGSVSRYGDADFNWSEYFEQQE